MVFVVLTEHIAIHSIDKRIRNFYPNAKIVAISNVTSGAAGDCRDWRSLYCRPTSGRSQRLRSCVWGAVSRRSNIQPQRDGTAGALLCFHSSNPNYSYAEVDRRGHVVRTAEKQVVSNLAIAGCYLFQNAATFSSLYKSYSSQCEYRELYISGMFNLMICDGNRVECWKLPQHFSFGTPADLAALRGVDMAKELGWGS